MIYSIKDKVILITGATGYLGAAMAKDLNTAGAKVIILSTSLEKARKLCVSLNINTSQAFRIDISNLDDIKSVFFEIDKFFGRIDVLVNNAYFGVAKKFGNYTDQDWYTSFDGTVISIDNMTQMILPYFKKKNMGRIINISSMYGIVSPNPDIYENEDQINPIGYGVGKASIIQYTKYAAMMLAKYGITVNTISYGPFPNIQKVTDNDFIDNLSKKTFLKRIGKQEDVSSAVFFLSLDESSYITGQNIIVDGGWTSW